MDLQSEIVKLRIKAVEDHIKSENLHDLDAIMGTFGHDARYDDEPWGEHHQGRGRVQSYYDDLIRAVPDLNIDVKTRHVTDENIILEVEISGTHKGLWRGAPGTGRRICFALCAIYSFDSQSKLAGERIYYDRATVLRQIGLFHEPVSFLGRLTTVLSHPVTMIRAGGRTLWGDRGGE
jgi:steroid delta-isomerase-like uncharacterized protein